MSIREDTAVERAASKKVVWDNLESFARGEVQRFIQALLEEEMTELLGRARSERRAEPESRLHRLDGCAWPWREQPIAARSPPEW